MKEVKLYETQDGYFHNNTDADKYIKAQEIKATVKEYLETKDLKPSTKTRNENAIYEFLLWQNNIDMEYLETVRIPKNEIPSEPQSDPET